ncbi:hypothetical protein [Pseudomonas folii]|uniref:Leucine-rich repeat domain-containing protein n=1 Tax=Pseudomonas folii TaxID=2762593 RepID=A0ABR7AW25_9PSED|nr:hypothetical protein [Pseudomonas folii]MBC3949126.1 hypothetical protein [Pseudomonas folii]
MLPQRIHSPSLHDLQTTVAELLGNSDEHVVVQFLAPEQYPAPILAALDALCAQHGHRLDVRFYGHYAADQPFDGRTLEALPNVQTLTLDCLYHAERLETLASLAYLGSLALGVDKLDLNPILALSNLQNLTMLRVFQEVGPKLDLASVSRLPHLRVLHLNAKTQGLKPLEALTGLTELSLYRQPATTTFEVISRLSGLETLSIGFGSREAMPELFSDSVTHLSLLRVRGLQALELGRFPSLEVLEIEDQPHLGELVLGSCSRLRGLRLANLKSLGRIDGLGEVPVGKLSIYKTPELDLLALLDQPLPELKAVRLVSGKRGVDQEIEARRETLGLALVKGIFEE